MLSAIRLHLVFWFTATMLCGASCAYDWTVPPAATTTNTTGQGAAGAQTASGGQTGSGGQTASGGHTSSGGMSATATGGMGGTPDPCKSSCDNCKNCVLAEYQGTATPTDCLIYVGCVLQCVGDTNCILGCQVKFTGGALLHTELQTQCAELCGGSAGCQ